MKFEKVFLVTGGQGFLGSRLVHLLDMEFPDCQILSIVRSKRRICDEYSSEVQLIYGDLRETETLANLPTNITHIFSLSATIPWKKNEKFKARIAVNNLAPIANLIEYSRKWRNLRQIIYSSSISVYGQSSHLLSEDSKKEPDDIYGASKLAGEDLLACLEDRGIKVVSLRYSSLYGYGQYPKTVLPIMVDRAIQKKDIFVCGSGNRTQDFLYFDDAAYANLLAYKQEARGVFNIGSGVPITMTELALAINKIFANREAEVVHVPERSCRDLGFRIDISKARKELRYDPAIQIENGLKMLRKEMGVRIR